MRMTGAEITIKVAYFDKNFFDNDEYEIPGITIILIILKYYINYFKIYIKFTILNKK